MVDSLLKTISEYEKKWNGNEYCWTDYDDFRDDFTKVLFSPYDSLKCYITSEYRSVLDYSSLNKEVMLQHLSDLDQLSYEVLLFLNSQN